jgi:long-subunit acyl-CoA synthetase (AMP-forming)
VNGLAFDAATMTEAFARTVAAHGDHVALRADDGGETTWAQWDADVDRYAAGLSERGIGRGDTVAFLLSNRPEAYALDMAALHTGACCYGIYATSAPEQIAHQLRVAQTRVLVTERATADAAGRGATLVEHPVEVLLVDEPASIGALAVAGGRRPSVEITAEDVATLIFTSGTTGAPKAAELTHGNVMEECRISQAVVGLNARCSLISYLPVAHVADRVLAYYYAIVTGGTIGFVADPRTFAAQLPRIRPHIFLSVPRMWDKLAGAVAAAGRAADPAFEEQMRRSIASVKGGDGPLDAPALRAMREQFGLADIEFAMSGSAPLSVETLWFFMGLGLPFCEGYGMSETTGIVVMNPSDAPRPGTIGKAAPGVQARLAPDGELLIRGGNVMRGYRGQPDATAEALRDGWMHTGDLARMDEDGYLTIVGRKKEIIISAAGKNMSPAQIEQAIAAESDLIGVVVCIGDGRPYNVGLVLLDPDALAPGMSVAQAALDTDVRAQVAAAVERGNARLSRPEQLKRHAILPETWLPGGEIMTPTQKVRRRVVDERYASEIEALFSA